MELSPSTIAGLLYGFDDFGSLSLESVDPRDTPILRVKVIPFDLGVELRSFDPGEKHFHIELYAGKRPPRAELWAAFAWQQSLSKALRHKVQQHEDRPTPLTSAVAQFQSELVHLLVSSRGLYGPSARAAAEMLVRGDDFNKEELLDLLRLPQTFVYRLEDLREKLNANNDIPVETDQLTNDPSQCSSQS